MRFLLILALLTCRTGLFSQTAHLKEFYPENTLYQKMRVKQVIDSFKINPFAIRIYEYDSLGRTLGDYDGAYKNRDNPYQYKKAKDTLFRLKYRQKNQLLYSFEMFVYSKSNKILKYVECRDSYVGDNKNQAHMNTFYYDSKDNLYCQIQYSSLNYPAAIQENMSIDTTKLALDDVIYYTYKNLTGKGIAIVAKHAFGTPAWRRTDTLLYDSKGQLFKESSFAEQSSMGEIVRSNVNEVRQYFIKKDEVTVVEFYTHCLADAGRGRCLETEKSPIGKRQIVFERNGLKTEEYSIYESGEKYLFCRYAYTFYDKR